MKIELTKPLLWKENEITTLDLNLEDLTGNDLIDTEDDLKRKGVSVNAWEYSRTYLVALAARALHIPADILKTLSAKDFTTIINEVLSFLAGTASEGVTPSD